MTIDAMFESISLSELNAAAELQTRQDRKYIVPVALLATLAPEIASDTRVLRTNGVAKFAYESHYFDTPERASYLAAVRQRPHGYKVRTRSYLDSDTCLLEVKTRNGRGETVKNRMEYAFADRLVLTEQGRSFVRNFAEVGSDAEDLEPVLQTNYQRTTLVLGNEPVRATVDVGLLFTDPLGGTVALRDYAVVETKTLGSHSAIDRLLWHHGHRPETFSKFGIGLAVLHPELPANRWNRVLRRYFHRMPSQP
jgi:hypothetical protein